MRAIVLAFATAIAVSLAAAPALAASCQRVTLPNGAEHLECALAWTPPYA
ncbi:hypothetical protein [Neomegalonema perideroedes]|nr:hypothetical protein [Neomegalonema perideroedes]